MTKRELISANSSAASRSTTTRKIFAQNPASLEHANGYSGKTQHGHITTCMCGYQGCSRKLAWRHAAIGDPLGIVGKYINIPALPIEPETEARKKIAAFVEMVYNTLGLPISLAVNIRKISILHWHPSQRAAMLRTKTKPLTRGLLAPDTDGPLIRRLLSEGHLSVDDELHGGFYFNKPKHTMQNIEAELEEQEIQTWTRSGQLLEKTVLVNQTIRPGKQPDYKSTFRGLLDKKISACAIDSDEKSCTKPEYYLPFFVRSNERNRFKKIYRRGIKISIDINDVGSTLLPMYASGADKGVRPAGGCSPSPLCKFNLN